ncbi:MAG: hypothetical protein ACE366_10270 [Bradymonadia bacterium]
MPPTTTLSKVSNSVQALIFIVLCVLLSGCSSPPEARGPWALAPTGSPPRWLSDVGVYNDLTTLTPSADFRLYTPAFPLWTNGSGKQRLVKLPKGATIDNADAVAWRFPVGTVIAKTFTYDDVEGRSGTVAVETRLMARQTSGWIYAEYLWNAEGTDARKMPEGWSARAVDLATTEGETRRHTLPGHLECLSCHETHRGAPVLGIDPLNTSPQMVEALPFSAPIKGQQLADLPGRTPEESAVMAYLIGNCTHCHHGDLEAGGENTSFSLLPDQLVARTVGQRTESSASGAGVRIVPRQPQRSAIFQAVVHAPHQTRPRFRPMPPLGVDVPDPEAKRLLETWIMQL